MTDSKTCPTCGKDSFNTAVGMKRHHARVHGESLVHKTGECERCGEEFKYYDNQGKGKYCSQECRKNRVSLTCETCGDKFEVIAAREDSARFCSRECKDNNPDKKERVEIPCEQCGERFEVPPHLADKRKYCSRSCNGKAGKGNLTAERVTIECDICGETFEEYAAKADKRRVCSVECANELKSKEQSGENHPHWKGGHVVYGAGWHDGKKIDVRVRDQARCQRCGMTDKRHHEKYSRSLSVHHIVPAREGGSNDMKNLITLCISCHEEVEQAQNASGNAVSVSS